MFAGPGSRNKPSKTEVSLGGEIILRIVPTVRSFSLLFLPIGSDFYDSTIFLDLSIPTSPITELATA
jgi:hypothetical protein